MNGTLAKLYFVGLVAAIAVPFAVFSTTHHLPALFKDKAKPATLSLPANTDAPMADTAGGTGQPGSGTGAGAIPTASLTDVLRFDVTIEWVLRHWPRVTTGLSQPTLQGYRVPLVSGTQITDVAGSLTYYFNPQQKVARIELNGTTGDPRAIASLLTERYHFTRRPTNDPGLVLFEAVNSSNQPSGSLKIRSAPVIKANQPYTRFEIELAIDRPEP